MNEVKKNNEKEKSIDKGAYKIPSTLNTISYGSAGFWMGFLMHTFFSFMKS